MNNLQGNMIAAVDWTLAVRETKLNEETIRERCYKT